MFRPPNVLLVVNKKQCAAFALCAASDKKVCRLTERRLKPLRQLTVLRRRVRHKPTRFVVSAQSVRVATWVVVRHIPTPAVGAIVTLARF